MVQDSVMSFSREGTVVSWHGGWTVMGTCSTRSHHDLHGSNTGLRSPTSSLENQRTVHGTTLSPISSGNDKVAAASVAV